ncbi:hypothetical protein OWV82_014916 [Melia azedarach]|uniref:Uncharacterized protein n=1 Tax=Melia azedarach TaxID=155640 RepID=A0ACC1XNI0_MELAZ|nr:hypothetical protein OWV82_014916 [Melia azedarach]
MVEYLFHYCHACNTILLHNGSKALIATFSLPLFILFSLLFSFSILEKFLRMCTSKTRALEMQCLYAMLSASNLPNANLNGQTNQLDKALCTQMEQGSTS